MAVGSMKTQQAYSHTAKSKYCIHSNTPRGVSQQKERQPRQSSGSEHALSITFTAANGTFMPWCTQQSRTITVRPKYAVNCSCGKSHHKSFVFPRKTKATLPSYFCAVKYSFGHQGNRHGTYRRKRTKFPSPFCQLRITRSNVFLPRSGCLRFRRAGRVKQH